MIFFLKPPLKIKLIFNFVLKQVFEGFGCGKIRTNSIFHEHPPMHHSSNSLKEAKINKGLTASGLKMKSEIGEILSNSSTISQRLDYLT